MSSGKPPEPWVPGRGRDRAPTRSESNPDASGPSDSRARETRSLPPAARDMDGGIPSLPTSPGVQGRKSYQGKRGGVRQSEEFDRRYDGPFARPSLVMTRRRSSAGAPAVASPGATAAAAAPGQQADLEKQETPGPLGTADSRRPEFLPEPPSLNYTLRTRKLSIAFFWSLIIFDSVALPIGLYFGLWYGVGPGANTPTQYKQKLSANAVFSIVTAAVGGASILEYFVRLRRLWRKDSTCRVIGARRFYLDAFHWNYSFGWIIVMIELIV